MLSGLGCVPKLFKAYREIATSSFVSKCAIVTGNRLVFIRCALQPPPRNNIFVTFTKKNSPFPHYKQTAGEEYDKQK